ncbi:MAG: hypothetical protein NC117_00590 [Pseudoflavonifractor sp.]|nr:hypothetical protein [Pseudoflavonifractor sp.]
MNEKERKGREDAARANGPQQPIQNAARSVPGQQIGLYGAESDKNVRQMVDMLNNPEDNSQKQRG